MKGTAADRLQRIKTSLTTTVWTLVIKSINNIQIWLQKRRGLPPVKRWRQENGGDTTKKYAKGEIARDCPIV